MIPNSVPTLDTTCECCLCLPQFQLHVSSPKEARRVWCGWVSRTYDHILIVHLHISPTEQPTPPTIVVHLKGVEGHKDTLHSDGQQRKIISLFVRSCVCVQMRACIRTCACAGVCAHSPQHPTHSPAWPAPGSQWMY